MRETYDHDIYADSVNDMRKPRYTHELACFYDWLDEHGDPTVDWVLDQIFLHHNGSLYGPRGNLIDREAFEPEEKFGIDTRRCINALKGKALMIPRQSAQRRVVERLMLLDFARTIYLGRIE